MLVANTIKSLTLGQYFWRGFRCGLRSRTAISQVVYAKALALSHEGRQEFGIGAMVSYMQIDAQKIADAIPYMHLLWQGPVQLIIATYMLCHFLGPSGLAGLAVMIITTPMNTLLSKRVAQYTKKTMAARDARVKFTNEILQGIKILKLFAWEPALLNQLNEKRSTELRAVRTNMIWSGMIGFVFNALPLIVTATTFIIFAAARGELTAARAYTALSLFQILRFPLLVVPMMLQRLMDVLVVNTA